MSTRTRSGPSITASPAVMEQRLQAFLDRQVRRRRWAHAVIGVARGDDRHQWVVSSGEASPGIPMRPDTPFLIASITKRFIATLVLQAQERGELALSDPMVAHLPAELTDGLHVRDGVDRTPDITVHNLVTHTSGLADYWDKPRSGQSLFRQLAHGEDRSWTLTDVVTMVRDQHRPHFPPQDLSAPRQRASYTDTGFQLLIAILEAATGRSFAELLHTRIFEPLGMEHSWLPGRSEPRAATPEPAMIYAGRRPLPLPQMIVSSNDLISTAGDLLRFQQALATGEPFDQPATAQRFTERANLLRNIPPNRYGVGTWIFRLNRLIAPGRQPITLIGHAGATGTWLFTAKELDLHLVGSVDQAAGKRAPFRLMASVLRQLYG